MNQLFRYRVLVDEFQCEFANGEQTVLHKNDILTLNAGVLPTADIGELEKSGIVKRVPPFYDTRNKRPSATAAAFGE